MAEKRTRKPKGTHEVTFAQINEILAHIEWEIRYTRALIQAIGLGTTVKLTDELKALQKTEPKSLRSYPC